MLRVMATKISEENYLYSHFGKISVTWHEKKNSVTVACKIGHTEADEQLYFVVILDDNS